MRAPRAAPSPRPRRFLRWMGRSARGLASHRAPVHPFLASRLLLSLGSIPLIGADAFDAGSPGPVAPMFLSDPTRPPGGEPLLLTGPLGEGPAAIPTKGPKVAAKKKLASRRVSSSLAIQLPLGEWPCDPPVSHCENGTSGAPGLSIVPSGATLDGPLALRCLEATVRLGEASNQALQASLGDLRRAVEVGTKVSEPRSSPSSPRGLSRLCRHVLEVLCFDLYRLM